MVLVHDADVELGGVGEQVWYPLWDSGRQHRPLGAHASTRCSSAAAADLRVAPGLLDARHLAGDPNLTLRLRTAVLTQWRRDARTRLAELRELVSDAAD